MSAPIFISHSSKDRKTALRICGALERRGLACWISSRDIRAGENYQEAIFAAIESASVMILVFTENANNSDDVKREIALASQKHILVVPARVEDVTPNPAFRYEFATRQWIDLFEDWETGIERLVSQIAEALGNVSKAGSFPPSGPRVRLEPPEPSQRHPWHMISPARVIPVTLIAAVVILLLGTAALKFGVPLGTAVQTTSQRPGFGRSSDLPASVQETQNISQRLSFGPSSGLPANVQEKLTASAAKFLKYFEGLGYHPKTEVIYFSTNPESHMASNYDKSQTINVDARWADDESLLFHEYSHLILFSSLPFNALSGPTRWKFSQFPIEFGLANYFTASARNWPLIGELAAQVSKTGTLSNLANGEKVTTLKPSDFVVATKLQDGWGGAFWDIRNKLGQAAADQWIYDAWRQMTDVDDAFVAQSFIRNLLNQARTAGGVEAVEAVRGILHDRGIPAT